jgi:hypothetical protein
VDLSIGGKCGDERDAHFLGRADVYHDEIGLLCLQGGGVAGDYLSINKHQWKLGGNRKIRL